PDHSRGLQPARRADGGRDAAGRADHGGRGDGADLSRPYTRHLMPVEITPDHPSVAILGAGAMGEALLRGLLAAGWASDEVGAAVRRPERAERVSRVTGCRVTLDPADALAGRQVVVVATK